MNIDAFHPLILNVGRTVLNADWNWQNVCSPFARILQNQQRSEWLRLESRGITYHLFSRFMMEAKEKAYIHDERIHKSVRYIQERLTESLSIHEMARDLNMSEEHFIRLFNKMVGSTPMLFINQKRIEKAQLLLLTTDASVKEISEKMGYTNSSYFVRVFRQITGKTPLAYKKENSI